MVIIEDFIVAMETQGASRRSSDLPLSCRAVGSRAAYSIYQLCDLSKIHTPYLSAPQFPPVYKNEKILSCDQMRPWMPQKP